MQLRNLNYVGASTLVKKEKSKRNKWKARCSEKWQILHAIWRFRSEENAVQLVIKTKIQQHYFNNIVSQFAKNIGGMENWTEYFC